MANCSVACGQVPITAQNEKMVETIHKSIFGVTCRFAYHTDINDDEMEVAITKHENGVSATYDFTGEGRWSYDNNIKDMLQCVKAYLLDTQRKDILAVLEENNFTLTFDYSDYEVGFEWITRDKIELVHAAGMPLQKSEYKVVKHEDFDWTYGNLVNIAGECEQYAHELFHMDDEA